uniref:Uncharacterized protein n=1 Tax=Knipowitschia caucasica TaxID=637954 RepID=A0AAV2LI14_KNICA
MNTKATTPPPRPRASNPDTNGRGSKRTTPSSGKPDQREAATAPNAIRCRDSTRAQEQGDQATKPRPYACRHRIRQTRLRRTTPRPGGPGRWGGRNSPASQRYRITHAQGTRHRAPPTPTARQKPRHQRTGLETNDPKLWQARSEGSRNGPERHTMPRFDARPGVRGPGHETPAIRLPPPHQADKAETNNPKARRTGPVGRPQQPRFPTLSHNARPGHATQGTSHPDRAPETQTPTDGARNERPQALASQIRGKPQRPRTPYDAAIQRAPRSKGTRPRNPGHTPAATASGRQG